MHAVRNLAILSLLLVLTLPPSRLVAADQPSAVQPAAPSTALTARFTAFLTDVLAGHLPATGLSDAMKAGFTPQLISQVDGSFTPLGSFQKLQFVRQDTLDGYQRYHYVAVFDKGSQPLLFVLDSSGNIAGFFKDQTTVVRRARPSHAAPRRRKLRYCVPIF